MGKKNEIPNENEELIDDCYENEDENDDEEWLDVQAHISCVSFPKSLEELHMIADYDDDLNPEKIINIDYEEGKLIWTVPRWSRYADIVLFYYSKSSNIYINTLKNQLKRSSDYSSKEVAKMQNLLERGMNLYKKYGGTIFAVGWQDSHPFYWDETNEFDHFKSKIYAEINKVYVFENPVHISEVNSFISIAKQASITPLFGEPYDKLVDLIYDKNEVLPRYLIYSYSTMTPLYDIKKSNWIKVNNEFERKYQFETQFRAFYVDYFLEELSDKKIYYTECQCIKDTKQPSYVDNVILCDGKFLPVEVKLNIDNEADIIGQVKKYCNLKKMFLKTDTPAILDKVISNKVLIIDTFSIFLYDDTKNTIERIIDLNEIKSKTEIRDFKDTLIKKL